MRKKEIKKLYLLQNRLDKRYYTQESELFKYINFLKKRDPKLTNVKVMEFDLVSESPAFNYVEGKEMENTRDLKMRVLLEDDPTAIKIEQLKNFLNETSIKHINLPSLNLINSSENLKSWVIRNHKYLFDFKSGDLDKDIEFFQLVLSIHNFKLSSLNSRYYFNSTLEEHPFYLAKIKKN